RAGPDLGQRSPIRFRRPRGNVGDQGEQVSLHRHALVRRMGHEPVTDALRHIADLDVHRHAGTITCISACTPPPGAVTDLRAFAPSSPHTFAKIHWRSAILANLGGRDSTNLPRSTGRGVGPGGGVGARRSWTAALAGRAAKARPVSPGGS